MVTILKYELSFKQKHIINEILNDVQLFYYIENHGYIWNIFQQQLILYYIIYSVNKTIILVENTGKMRYRGMVSETTKNCDVSKMVFRDFAYEKSIETHIELLNDIFVHI